MSTPPSSSSTDSSPSSSAPPGKSNGNQSLLDAIFATATDYAIITFDIDRNIVSWNAGAEIVFGYRAEEILGQSADLIFTPEDRAMRVPEQEAEVARDSGRTTDYRWHLRKDGSRFWADGVMTPIRDKQGQLTGYLKILRDGTEKKRAEMDLLRMAKLDGMTGLANRASFMPRLRELSSAALRSNHLLLLLLIDLDKFKQVNDRWGHAVGDQLLQQAVTRMRRVTRDTDFLARLGGDEFVILQPDAHSPHDGAMLADKLVRALASPFEIEGKDVSSGASIGIAVFPHDAGDTEQLLKNADMAMYQIKKQGGGGYHYFTESLDREAHQRDTDLDALKQAIAAHDFRLDYQPEVNAATGRTTAVEALLRCTHPLLEHYPIETVIELANETGLMIDIGLWVMREACGQLRCWREAGLSTVRMCINLCPAELISKELSGYIGKLLAEMALTGSDVEVEVTERQLLDQGTAAMSTLGELRAQGISVAIDDFGTGYSSLSYLRNLPADKVKLDQSFLKQIPADADSCAIASAIVNLAHTLKLKTVIEGVESPEQAQFFRDQNSELLQGYYFSRPLTGEQMTLWLGREQ